MRPHPSGPGWLLLLSLAAGGGKAAQRAQDGAAYVYDISQIFFALEPCWCPSRTGLRSEEQVGVWDWPSRPVQWVSPERQTSRSARRKGLVRARVPAMGLLLPEAPHRNVS